MQRWILLGFGAALLMMGGLYFAYQQYKLNRPQPMWVPLSVREDLPVAELDRVTKELKEKLCVKETFVRVSKDLGLPAKWELATDEEAAAELMRRVYVRTGDLATPKGNVPAVHIGVNGKVKEKELSGQIAMRLMQDVWKILGVDPPKKKP